MSEVKDIISIGMFQDLESAKGTHVVKISTPTCGPCKMMAPIFDKIAEEIPEHSYYSLMPSQVPGMPEVMNKLGIASAPTFLVYTDGVLTTRVVGAVPKSALIAKLGL